MDTTTVSTSPLYTVDIFLVLLAAFAGGAMGFIANIVYSFWLRFIERKRFEKIVRLEMVALKQRSVIAAFGYLGTFGKSNTREFLEWSIKQFTSIDTPSQPQDKLLKLLKEIRKSENWDEVSKLRGPIVLNSIFISQIRLSVLDKSFERIGLLKEDFAEQLLNIYKQVGYLNDIASLVEVYVSRNYDRSIIYKDRESNIEDLKSTAANYGELSMTVCEDVDALLLKFD